MGLWKRVKQEASVGDNCKTGLLWGFLLVCLFVLGGFFGLFGVGQGPRSGWAHRIVWMGREFSHNMFSCSEEPGFLEKGVFAASTSPSLRLCGPRPGGDLRPVLLVLWENLGETPGTSFLRRTLAHGETGAQCAFPGTGVSAPRRIRLTWSVYLCGKYIVFSLCFREYAQLPFFK